MKTNEEIKENLEQVFAREINLENQERPSSDNIVELVESIYQVIEAIIPEAQQQLMAILDNPKDNLTPSLISNEQLTAVLQALQKYNSAPYIQEVQSKLEEARKIEAGNRFELGENSEFYKLLTTNTPSRAAPIIEKIPALSKALEVWETEPSSMQKFLAHIPHSLWDKIAKIGEEIDQRSKRGAIQKIKNFSTTFQNSMAAIFAQNFTVADASQIIKEIENIEKKSNIQKKEENIKAPLTSDLLQQAQALGAGINLYTTHKDTLSESREYTEQNDWEKNVEEAISFIHNSPSFSHRKGPTKR